MLDGRDDVEALTRVLNGLQQELNQQRQEINEMCQVADEIGGIEPLDIAALEAHLQVETKLTRDAMDTLSVAEQELDAVMKRVREFSRVQTIKSLSLQKDCGDQVFEWTQKVDKEYMELIKFHEQCMEVDRKLAKLVAHLA